MISKLDHVNIVTKNIGETIRFYTEVLGMKNAPLPGGMASNKNAFICDDNDNAVLHIQGVDPANPQPTFDITSGSAISAPQSSLMTLKAALQSSMWPSHVRITMRSATG
jgi:hypothetical protein